VLELAASSLSVRDAYAWMTGIVVPRPIAWVTTSQRLGDGSRHINVAPFSYFSGLGSDPPLLTLGIASRADGSDKDTLRLLRVTGVGCVHLVEQHHLLAMNASSAELPAEESELPLTGLTTELCRTIDGVRLVGVRAGLECRLRDVHRYAGKRSATSLVVLEVVHVFVADTLLGADGAIDPNAMTPVGRLGGPHYCEGGTITRLERPQR
jgi:flavin reductase (DIM6/NTAB) family NADH-FMN oxidoreductase RutF